MTSFSEDQQMYNLLKEFVRMNLKYMKRKSIPSHNLTPDEPCPFFDVLGYCYYCCESCNYDDHRCYLCGDYLNHFNREPSGAQHPCYAPEAQEMQND